MKKYLVLLMMAGFVLNGILTSHAQGTRPQTETKPFIMPVAGESSPSTWILGQPYGNTTGAFVSGANSYSAGQFLHFGIDISMACGTPLVAVADGVVDSVDNRNRGSAPHNLLLTFPDIGITVLYGHLLERPNLVAGQPVKQGEVVALSGEPEGDCNGRTHLHFEVRSLDHRIAYNPIHYIEAPWHSLLGIDARSRPAFQRDLTNPRRWMSLEDQPDVHFGGVRLNNYTQTWPLTFNRRAPTNTLPDRPFTSVSQLWTLRQIGMGGCCAGAWWHPTDDNRLYFIDGNEGQLASIFEVTLDFSQPPTIIQAAPPLFLSADGTHEIIYERNRTVIRRLEDMAEWHLPISDNYPNLSPNNEFLLWTQGDNFRDVWVASLDGSFSEVVWRAVGRNTTARWLDSERLLISEREEGRFNTLSVLNIQDGASHTLGTWYNIRNLQIAPGGDWILLFSTFSPDPALNGLYAIGTQPEGEIQKLEWFGDYRWRDSESLYYITYNANDVQQLNYYHAPSGETTPLTNPETLPFTIGNGDWSVSPDGNTILFQDARDGNLWLLEAEVSTSQPPSS